MSTSLQRIAIDAILNSPRSNKHRGKDSFTVSIDVAAGIIGCKRRTVVNSLTRGEVVHGGWRVNRSGRNNLRFTAIADRKEEGVAQIELHQKRVDDSPRVYLVLDEQVACSKEEVQRIVTLAPAISCGDDEPRKVILSYPVGYNGAPPTPKADSQPLLHRARVLLSNQLLTADGSLTLLSDTKITTHTAADGSVSLHGCRDGSSLSLLLAPGQFVGIRYGMVERK